MFVTENEFLQRSEVLQLLGLSQSSSLGWFRRLIEEQGFPGPVTRGGGRGEQSLWHRPAVEAWLNRHSTADTIVMDGMVYLSLTEIARRTGRTERTVRHWITTKKLPAPDWQFRRRDGIHKFWKEKKLLKLGILTQDQ